jgi:hypothetical protein
MKLLNPLLMQRQMMGNQVITSRLVAQIPFTSPVGLPTVITLPAYSTQGVVITSHDPTFKFGTGGGAGLISHLTTTGIRGRVQYAVNHLGAGSNLENLLDALRTAKSKNNGNALSNITLDTHGADGIIGFADGSAALVERVVKSIMEAKCLSAGGIIRFDGCNIAHSKESQLIIGALAKKYSITIVANKYASGIGLSPKIFEFLPSGRVNTHYVFDRT